MNKFKPDTTLRIYFKNDPVWVQIASSYYHRLPRWGMPATEKKMRQWLRKLKITETEYLTATGYKQITDFSVLNPDWPLRAFVGLLFEYVDERDGAKDVLKAYGPN